MIFKHRNYSWSLVVTRGHSWSFVVTRGHSWSLVVTRGHSWSLVCTFRQDQKYMYAETPRLADKTIVFSEHEVFKLVIMVTR